MTSHCYLTTDRWWIGRLQHEVFSSKATGNYYFIQVFPFVTHLYFLHKHISDIYVGFLLLHTDFLIQITLIFNFSPNFENSSSGFNKKKVQQPEQQPAGLWTHHSHLHHQGNNNFLNYHENTVKNILWPCSAESGGRGLSLKSSLELPLNFQQLCRSQSLLFICGYFPFIVNWVFHFRSSSLWTCCNMSWVMWRRDVVKHDLMTLWNQWKIFVQKENSSLTVKWKYYFCLSWVWLKCSGRNWSLVEGCLQLWRL